MLYIIKHIIVDSRELIEMYEVTIKTQHNTIQFATDDINDEQFKEILDQPWVEDVEIKSVQSTNFKKLVRREEHERGCNKHNE
jgi:tRNA G18 (ribose-2'-O)-methylase SpoU